jgi:hypothetical protein
MASQHILLAEAKLAWLMELELSKGIRLEDMCFEIRFYGLDF